MLTHQQGRKGKKNSFSKFLRIINQRTVLILTRLGHSSAFHLTRYRVQKVILIMAGRTTRRG
jgi:hypothetical protein